MKKVLVFTFVLLLIGSIAHAAVGSVAVSGSLSGSQKTTHVAVNGTGTAKETIASSADVSSVYVISHLYRNDELIEEAEKYEWTKLSATVSVSANEYNNAQYQNWVWGQVFYEDDTYDFDQTDYYYYASNNCTSCPE